jgi:hypothetical protein
MQITLFRNIIPNAKLRSGHMAGFSILNYLKEAIFYPRFMTFGTNAFMILSFLLNPVSVS